MWPTACWKCPSFEGLSYSYEYEYFALQYSHRYSTPQYLGTLQYWYEYTFEMSPHQQITNLRFV